MRINWKNIQPTSLTHALRLCKDYAIERKRLSVERIADLMGVTHDSLYKWLSTGRMPAVLIPAYEHACGVQFVTRWLAVSSNKLIVDMPTGRQASNQDIQSLHLNFSQAIAQLINFYNGTETADNTLASLQTILQDLVGHRENVLHYHNPQLALEHDDE